MKNTGFSLAVVVIGVVFASAGVAEEVWTLGERSLPASAGVSDELHEFIKKQPAPDPEANLKEAPTSFEAWKAAQNMLDEQNATGSKTRAASLGVTYEQETVDGVVVYRLKPAEVDPRHADHLFLHTHGGGYVFGGGLAAIGEGVMIAALAKIPVLSVDYRMPPDHPFPAAVDDVVTVYKHLLKERPASTIAIGGTSAGGGLPLAAIHRFKQLGIEVPGVAFAGTPWSDLTKTGDSYFINEGVDHVLVSYEGYLDGMAQLYADGHDLKDPLISPVYGDFGGFPPTFLVTGTRDLFLSNTVRVHTKMRAADVIADLMVFEGIAHADYAIAFGTPESRQTFTELGHFLLEHLGVD